MKWKLCPECNGYGKKQCSECFGKGTISRGGKDVPCPNCEYSVAGPGWVPCPNCESYGRPGYVPDDGD